MIKPVLPGMRARGTGRIVNISSMTGLVANPPNAYFKQFADHLPGDPKKVADAVLMVSGLDDPPLRLLLGRDVLKATRDKLAAMSASIEEWKSVTKDVNFPGS